MVEKANLTCAEQNRTCAESDTTAWSETPLFCRTGRQDGRVGFFGFLRWVFGGFTLVTEFGPAFGAQVFPEASGKQSADSRDSDLLPFGVTWLDNPSLLIDHWTPIGSAR